MAKAGRKRRHSGMARYRAAQFPPKTRAQFLEWDVREVDGNVHITISPPGEPSTQMRVDPDDAYDFVSAVNSAIDQAVGIR